MFLQTAISKAWLEICSGIFRGNQRSPSCGSGLGKELAPYRIGKHSNPQNRAKIHQKYTKNRISGMFGVFLPYFASRGIFLFSRGPTLSQIWTFPEKSGKPPGLETPRFSFSQEDHACHPVSSSEVLVLSWVLCQPRIDHNFQQIRDHGLAQGLSVLKRFAFQKRLCLRSVRVCVLKRSVLKRVF